MADSDQHFLLLFIVGIFFGPDIIAEYPKKSALQRLSENLPWYTSAELEDTIIKLLLVQKVYYHVLRRARKSLVLSLSCLREFFRGELFIEPNSDMRQFPDLFPTHMHERYTYGGDRYIALKNVVFINNPDISYVKPEDIERFKRLTGLEHFELDIDLVQNTPVGAEVKLWKPRNRMLLKGESSSQGSLAAQNLKRKRASYHATGLANNAGGPTVSVLLPRRFPAIELITLYTPTKGGLLKRIIKRPFGFVDVGTCNVAYHFRVPLPRVAAVFCQDDLTCLLKQDGRFLIDLNKRARGRSAQRALELNGMQEGHRGLTVAFRLPGPVKFKELDVKLKDGVVEGTVPKDIIEIDE